MLKTVYTIQHSLLTFFAVNESLNCSSNRLILESIDLSVTLARTTKRKQKARMVALWLGWQPLRDQPIILSIMDA